MYGSTTGSLFAKKCICALHCTESASSTNLKRHFLAGVSKTLNAVLDVDRVLREKHLEVGDKRSQPVWIGVEMRQNQEALRRIQALADTLLYTGPRIPNLELILFLLLLFFQ